MSAPRPSEASGRGAAVRFRLCAAEFFYNGCFASANFLSVFLQSLGMTAAGIGLVTSLTNGMNILGQAFWGALSDKMRSVRRGFLRCVALSGACALLIAGLAGVEAAHTWAIGLAVGLLYFFLTPANMLMEQWLVRVDRNPRLGIPYGSVRIWASVSFAVVSLAYVPILKKLPVRSVYVFYAIFAALSALAAGRVPADSEGDIVARPRLRLREMPFRRILSFWVVGYLLFEILFQIPFGWRSAYMVYALNAFGLESRFFGAFMFVSGVFEVPMLLLCRRIIRRLGLAWPLVLSAAMLMGENAVYAWGRSMPSLIFAQVLRGFGFALYVACRHQFISRLAPKDLENSTLALINAAYAAVNILTVALGGYVLQALGTRGFFALTALLQLASCALLTGLEVVGTRFLRKPLPDRACLLSPLAVWGDGR